MSETTWNDYARISAGERFRAQSAEMGTAVTDALVEAAAVAPGMRVLDVACGAGEPAISLATALGDTGEVVGIDISEMPLEVASQRAGKRGLWNVRFLRGDVHALDFADASFDRVTSRLGVMFFSDLPRALAEMRRVLKPAGRVALLAWGAMEQPYFEMSVGTARRLHPELEVPTAAQQMFKFGRAGELGAALAAAGFTGIEEKLHSLRWDWHGSPEELWDYFRSVTVPFRPLIERIEGDREMERAVLARIGESFDGEYVRIQAQMVIATADRG
jgi:ubiquinone/menaquinone biosynthesis C-methylase UbiE